MTASGELTTTSTPAGQAASAGTASARPWEAPNAPSTSYNGVVSTYNNSNNSGSLFGRPAGGYGYGGGAYGSAGYGGGMYGSGSYGGGMYGSGYGSGYGTYGSLNGSGMYGSGYGGGSMYGSSYGGSMYGRPGGMYGAGQMGDPNNPMMGGPPAPPSGWQAMLAGLSGIMHFFGRLSFLVDENAHAVHFFVSALLQLLDRAGSLYGELARFILRILGIRRAKTASKALVPAGAQLQDGPRAKVPALPPSTPSAPFDSVWKKEG